MRIEHSKSPTSLQRQLCIESRIYLPLYCGKNVIPEAIPILSEKGKQRHVGLVLVNRHPPGEANWLSDIVHKRCLKHGKIWMQMDCLLFPVHAGPEQFVYIDYNLLESNR